MFFWWVLNSLELPKVMTYSPIRGKVGGELSKAPKLVARAEARKVGASRFPSGGLGCESPKP